MYIEKSFAKQGGFHSSVSTCVWGGWLLTY
jgi:hypothetical protein